MVVTLQHNLTAQAIQQLFDHECCAVVVKGFCDASTCDRSATLLLEDLVLCFSSFFYRKHMHSIMLVPILCVMATMRRSSLS